MYRKNNLRYPHRVDVYSSEREEQPSGQRKLVWTLDGTVRCQYVPHRATVRTSPTAEETEKVMFFINDDSLIDFKTRLGNLRDRNGNEFPHLIGKTFEIVQINHFSNYAGKPHHVQIIAETVIE